MNKQSRIWIAGSETLAGQALASLLKVRGYLFSASSTGDLQDSKKIEEIFLGYNPEYVFLTAGKSSGISGNQKFPASLMRDNLLPELLVMEAAQKFSVKKLLFLASSCVYPKNCPQPMRPEHLWTSSLEATCQSYALSKLTGLELCRAYRLEHRSPFISVIPSDIFGPEDSFDAEDSHVIASVIVKFYDAKRRKLPSVTLWGTGSPLRDFIFSEDLASGCLYLMESYSGADPINLSASSPVSIQELAECVRSFIGFEGEIVFDSARPDGSSAKVLCSEKISQLGWSPDFSFKEGLKRTCEAFLLKQEPAVHA